MRESFSPPPRLMISTSSGRLLDASPSTTFNSRASIARSLYSLPYKWKRSAIKHILLYKIKRFLYSAVAQSSGLLSALHFTPPRLLWEAFSHTAISVHRLLVHKYSPLSIARYSFIHLSKLEQYRVKKFRVLLVENPMLYL